MVRTLLELGADAEVPDAGGWLPIHEAAAANQVRSPPTTPHRQLHALVLEQEVRRWTRYDDNLFSNASPF